MKHPGARPNLLILGHEGAGRTHGPDLSEAPREPVGKAHPRRQKRSHDEGFISRADVDARVVKLKIRRETKKDSADLLRESEPGMVVDAGVLASLSSPSI
jgi:hypothetical protein